MTRNQTDHRNQPGHRHDQDRKDSPESLADKNLGLLGDIDATMHPMDRAMELQRRCASVGFDWNDPSGARKKLFEEIAELDEAWTQGRRDRIDSEMGDVLLAALNWARLLGTDPGRALAAALDRFEARFAIVERTVARSGKRLDETSLEELEAAWQEAKRELAARRDDSASPPEDQPEGS